MKLVDKAVRALALRWLASKVRKMRQGGNAVLKLLDGWKSFLVVVGFIGATLYALVTGHDVGGLVQAFFGAIGWADADLIERARVFATVIAPLLLAIWAAGSRLLKAWHQYRAGATPAELLSSAGYIKAALSAGKLEATALGPALRK